MTHRSDLYAAIPSQISSHDDGCCWAAQSWLVAMARTANVEGGASPAWVGDRIPWGPVDWPFFWCQLFEEPTGDCGVHAAVAAYTSAQLGARVRRVQLILAYGHQEVAHWTAMWGGSGSTTNWTNGTCCYHETVALGEDEINIPDATESVMWTGAQDGIVALRFDDPHADGSVWWERRQLPLNTWVKLSGA